MLKSLGITTLAFIAITEGDFSQRFVQDYGNLQRPSVSVTQTVEETIEVFSSETEELSELADANEVAKTVVVDFNLANSFSNTKASWYYMKNTDNMPPTAQQLINLEDFSSYYLGDTDKKEIFLTFDNGYENGYTTPILDTLKDKEVTAAFFVTKSYIDRNPELINRMLDEGHIVGNHSSTHPSFPGITSENVVAELNDTAQAYKDVTGEDMPLYFRPPMGEYSERVLNIADQMGYKTIFWSFAYKDWLVDEQPGAKYAYDTTIAHMHSGAIPLLHSVSSSNAEALGDIIDTLKSSGYTFLSLDELPEL